MDERHLNAAKEWVDIHALEAENEKLREKLRITVSVRDDARASSGHYLNLKRKMQAERDAAIKERDELSIAMREMKDAKVAYENDIIADAVRNERMALVDWLEQQAKAWDQVYEVPRLRVAIRDIIEGIKKKMTDHVKWSETDHGADGGKYKPCLSG